MGGVVDSTVLRKLVGYASYMFGANAFTAMITFAISAAGMVSRSKEAFGDYTLYMAIYSVGQGFFIFGINACIQQWCAADPEYRVRFTNIAYRLFLALLAVFGFVGAVLGLSVGWVYGLGLIAIPFMVVYWWARYIFRSTLDAGKEATLLITISLSNSVGRFFFLTFTDHRDALIYGDFASVLAAGLTAIFFLPRGIGSSFSEVFHASVRFRFVREVLQFARPLWTAGIVFLVNGGLQAAFLKAALGAAPLGAFGAYRQMWQFVNKPIDFISQATLPSLVRAGERRDELFRDILRVCLVSLPLIALGVSIGSPFIFHIIDLVSRTLGVTSDLLAKYPEVPLLMLLSVLAVPPRTAEMVLNQHSIAERRQSNVLYAQLVNVLLVAVTIYPFAKAFGVYGVIMSTVVGEIGNTLVYTWLLRDSHPAAVRFSLKNGSMALACAAPIACLGYLFRDAPYGWVLAFPAVGLYILGMFAVRLMFPSDVRRLLRLAQKRPRLADAGH